MYPDNGNLNSWQHHLFLDFVNAIIISVTQFDFALVMRVISLFQETTFNHIYFIGNN